MAVATDPIRSSVELALRGKRRDTAGRLFQLALLAALLMALLILFWLLVTTLQTAWPTITTRGADFLQSNVSRIASRSGVRQGIVGSFILAGFVFVFAVPLGIAAAIYLQEYAKDTRLNRALIANIRNLAGVPSIVYGILGLVVFVQVLRPITGEEFRGLTYMSGGLTLAVLAMPIMILVTMEALRTVPLSIREAAYGVGSTRWEVVRSHVLPYAAPGIFTGMILTLGRAIGETAPLLLVGAALGYFSSPAGRSLGEILQGPYTALPALVFSWSRLPGEEWNQNTAAAIVTLLVVILVINAVAIALRNRYERKW